VPEFLRAKV